MRHRRRVLRQTAVDLMYGLSIPLIIGELFFVCMWHVLLHWCGKKNIPLAYTWI